MIQHENLILEKIQSEPGGNKCQIKKLETIASSILDRNQTSIKQ